MHTAVRDMNGRDFAGRAISVAISNTRSSGGGRGGGGGGRFDDRRDDRRSDGTHLIRAALLWSQHGNNYPNCRFLFKMRDVLVIFFDLHELVRHVHEQIAIAVVCCDTL